MRSRVDHLRTTVSGRERKLSQYNNAQLKEFLSELFASEKGNLVFEYSGREDCRHTLFEGGDIRNSISR